MDADLRKTGRKGGGGGGCGFWMGEQRDRAAGEQFYCKLELFQILPRTLFGSFNRRPMAAMRTDRALPWFWFWLWFWFWFGLSICGDDPEQTTPGPGQSCDGTTGGRCDRNLSCVPDYTPDPGDEAGAGVCVRVTPPAGCVPCSEVECSLENWECPGGYVIDPCGCCPHCARQRGQMCGGPHWGRGYCDRGLTCALILGNAPATPPETGVCKALPGTQRYPWVDKQCPWVWGCNVRMSSCDCYGEQTCHRVFRYRHLQDCRKVMEEDRLYEMEIIEKMERGEEEEEWTCMLMGCKVQEDRCVCQMGSCGSQLSRGECEKELKRLRCASVTCPVVPVPSCPPDSFLTKPYIPLHQCCPQLPALCTCDFEKCPAKPPDCPPGHRAHIVTRGNGRPGNCCHRYLCRPGEESATQNRDEEEE
ncbi:cysteine-rich motor neuron 1 protein-like [Anguilla anguilla]|uniref:cysteine-rich motor neuron 1 protein-like n=1 Tax=Anguilla anguilla TaxID=7936 RepID=UPI0015B11192|nr:cysteine-rich motor neuron 1 protein-like [Anguilla anguilla]XP_035268172.1 cysteine-rich motor neuron 1 protein-like [Anguilla anguilla]